MSAIGVGGALGDRFEARERLVVSPATGIFVPNPAIVVGRRIAAGTVVGSVGDDDVRCLFDGEFQDFLAAAGERLRLQQPIAWLRTAGDADAA
jgi:[acyl-carrier-protein] S-malonyltransferase